MYRSRHSYYKPRRGNITKDILNIATIISCLVASIKLAIWGVLSVEAVVVIMFGVVVFVAISNAYAKLALALIALYLLIKRYAGIDESLFFELLGPFIALILVLTGLYVIVKTLFR